MALNFSTCDEYSVYKGRLGRGCSWTREETMLLLDLYEKERLADDRGGVEFPPRNTPKYQKVHQAISGFLGAHGYTRTPMQVRERLKRLKRDFRENRHGEFTDRVGAILAKRAAAHWDRATPASPTPPPQATPMVIATPNTNGGAPSTASGPSPDHSMEACYPVVLVKTELGSPDHHENEIEEKTHHQPSPIASVYQSPPRDEDNEHAAPRTSQRPRRFTANHGEDRKSVV